MYNVSVIISAWNAHCWLRECLESILEQNYTKQVPERVEILLGIDGCKPTVRWWLANKYRFPDVRCFYSGKNVGNYLIYNSLIQKSIYDYVLFFGADDYMVRGFMDYDFELSERDAEVIGHCYNTLNQRTQVVELEGIKRAAGVLTVKKTVFDRIGAFEPWRCAADTEFNNRIHRNQIPIAWDKRITFTRRNHSDSVTKAEETGWRSELRKKYCDLIEAKKERNEMKIETKTIELTPVELVQL